MALSKMSNITAIIEQLEGSTVCPVCLETYGDPRALPCTHVLCINCIQSKLQHSRHRRFSCPVCKHKTVVSGSSDVFPVSFQTKNLIQIVKNAKAAGSTNCQPCKEDCETSLAITICIDCGLVLCSRCQKHHNRYLTSHVCLELGSLTKQSVTEIASKKANLYICSRHGSKLR